MLQSSRGCIFLIYLVKIWWTLIKFLRERGNSLAPSSWIVSEPAFQENLHQFHVLNWFVTFLLFFSFSWLHDCSWVNWRFSFLDIGLLSYIMTNLYQVFASLLNSIISQGPMTGSLIINVLYVFIDRTVSSDLSVLKHFQFISLLGHLMECYFSTHQDT